MSVKTAWSMLATQPSISTVTPLDAALNLEEIMIGKEARSDFKKDVRRLLSNLVNFSLYVKQIPNEKRKETARKFLNNVNGWLYRRKLNPLKVKSESHQYLYEGILFPFSVEGEVSSTLVISYDQIVRIIHSEVNLFETKNRVPYRMVVETIE